MTKYKIKVTDAILELTHKIVKSDGLEKEEVIFTIEDECYENECYSVAYDKDDSYSLIKNDKIIVTVPDHCKYMLAIMVFSEAIKYLEEE